MVTWIIFENHLLEVGLTQNQETMALRTLTTVDLFYFYHVWRPAWIETHWNSIWFRAWAHMTSHFTWESVTTLHDFEGVLGWPLDTFFWALTIPLSRLLTHVWSDPNLPMFLLTPSIILWLNCPFRGKGRPTCSFNNVRHANYIRRNSSKFQVERWGKWA